MASVAARVAVIERRPVVQRWLLFEALLLRAAGQPGGYSSHMRSHRMSATHMVIGHVE
jgi:hypothetical protein